MFTLTIKPVIPSVNITGSNQVYNVGDVANALTATASAGMIIQWWGQQVGGSPLSSPVLPTTNGVGVTNYYVNQIDNNGSGCQSTPRQLVTVTVSPAAPDISVNNGINGNTINYCQNAIPSPLTASSIVGATLNWYSVPTGGLALGAAPTPSTGTATTTSYYVSQTYNGLTSPRVQVIVVVNPTPVTPGAITGIQNPTAGDLVNYSISPVQNATSYIWSLPSDWTGSSTIDNIDASVGTANGYVRVAAVINGCTSTFQQLSVGLKPISPNISGNTGIVGNTVTYCQGATPAQLSATGANGASFKWYTVPTGGTASSIAPTPSTATGSTVISYYVSQTVNGIESDRAQIDIVTNPLPAQPSAIIGVANPLENTAQNYSVTLVGGVSYAWTVPNLWTITSASGSSTIAGNTANGIGANAIATTVNSAGTIQVVPTLNGCIGSPQTLNIGIKPPVVDVTGVGPYIYCQGDVAGVLSATPINGATLKWYTNANGGTALTNAPTPSTSTSGIQNYYVSQILNGVESDRSLITVTVNAAPTVVSLVTTQPTCSIPTGTIVATGGAGNLFSIDGGVTFVNNTTFSNLQAGTTYNIIQKDANACLSPIASTSLIAAPIVPAIPTISSSANAVVCSGGTVTLTANIGVVNYTPTYQWFNNANGTATAIGGANNATYTTLLSGNYSVVVTNPTSGCASGVSSVTNVTIVAPAAATISQINQLGTDNLNCTTKPVLLSVTTNASSPSYQWQSLTNANTNTFANTGSPTSNTAAQTGLDDQYETNTIGTYRVLVTDGYGCVKISDPFVIQSVSSSPSISTICQGANAQLTATTTGLTGTNSYQWQISANGLSGTYTNVSSNGTSANYNAGLAGFYQVIVSNTYSGSTTLHTSCPAQVVVNQLPTVSITGYNANCAGSTTTLTGVASSSVSITTYQWLSSGIEMNGANNTSFATTSSGKYDLKVVDANGCIATTSNNTNNNSLIFNPPPALPVATVTQPDCSISTGTITVNSPGAGSYIYNIVSGNYSATNNTGLFSGLTAGLSYNITITDNTSGCTSPVLTIGVNNIPAVPTTPSVSIIDPTCITATGTISITSLGANYTYSINGINYQSSSTFSGLNAGTYSVTSKYNNGCASAVANATIAIQPITPATPGSINGNLTVNTSSFEAYNIDPVSGATSYIWTLPSNTWTITTGINSNTITVTTGNIGGLLSVAASSNGCTSAPQSITIVAKPSSPSVTNSTFCQGVIANSIAGNATVTNGGTLNWYTLSTGGTAAYVAPTPSTGSAGTQTFYVSQTINGIESDRVAITITVNPAPATLSVNITQPTCNVNTATISLTGGVANAIFVINSGLYSNSTGLFSNIPANATYSITQTNPLTGCTSLATNAIVNPALVPPSSPTFTITQPNCSNSAGIITVTNNIGASFSYSIDNINYQLSPIFNNIATGSYSLTVKNLDGCVSGVVSVTINPQPLPDRPFVNGSLTPTNINVCAGIATTLTASVTSSPTTGSNNANLTYQWYKDNVLVAGAINTLFNPTSTGNYTVIATNGLGCTSAASGTVSVTINPLPTASITGGAELAFTDCTQTKIVLTANSNASSPTYQWQVLDVVNNIYTNVGTPSSGTPNLTGQFSSFEVGVAGSYKVVVTSNGCSTSSAVTKIVNAPAVNALALTTICQGATVNLSATGSFTSYQWQQNTGGGYVNISTNGTNPILIVSNGGDYRVVATTGGNTTTSCPITITSNSLPISNVSIAPSSSICAGTPATLTSNTFGTSPFIYQWNVDGNPIAGATSNTYSATIGGDYAVKVIDANGCESLSPVSTLTVNALPARPTEIDGVNVVIAGATQTYSITPVSGASSYTWTLPNGWTGTSISNTIRTLVGNTGGTITVIANANGCSSPAQSLLISLGSLTNDASTAYINVPANGNIASNDLMPSGTTYGQPTQISGAFITVNSDGTYSFTATAAGTYTYTIPVCAPGQTSNCPTETLVITVPVNTLIDDAATAYQNVPSSGNIATNDSIPVGTTYGQPAQLTGATIIVNGDGTYTFTATAAGTYTYTIPVCAPGQITNCPTETLVISVPENNLVDDAANAYINIPSSGNLSTNDNIPAGSTYGQPAQLTGATITVNGDGTYSFTATTAGTYTYTVPVCAPGQTSNCPTETLVIVIPINNLVNDTAIALVNIPNSGNIATNDNTPAGTTYGQPSQLIGATITVGANGTYTFTATVAGTYTYTIPVCAPGQTSNCPTEILVINVPVNNINADASLAYVNIPSSGNISSNDDVPAGTTYGQPAQFNGASLTINPDGTYIFNATNPGTYSYTISVCAPGQTSNCPTQILVITVPVNTIINDAANALVNIPNIGNISSNDNVPAGTSYGQPAQINGATIIVNANGSYSFTATNAGTYTYTIPVCAPGQTSNCPTQILLITVPVNNINADAANAFVNIPSAGNIATNDNIPAGSTYGQPTQIANATITVNANGTYSFTATNAGTYTYTIPVCAPGQTINCPTETLVITVPVNTINNDTAIAYQNIPTSGNISTNDLVPAGTTYGQPAQITGATININANGTYSFTATAAGTYTYIIPVCAPGQTINCPTETLVITVPVNTINNDAALAYQNIPKSGNLSTNDIVPVGTTYGQPAQLPGATIVVNGDGTYSFTATAAGTYTYTIPVCAPGQTNNCPTETLVITVPINTIIPDIAATIINIPVSGNISTNDVVPAGTKYGQPAVNPSNPTGGNITVNADGTYTFTATVPGKYMYYVPTCAPSQTIGCPLTPLEITVVDLNPIVNNDIATTPTGIPTTVNVLANDKAGNTGGTLNTSSVSISKAPAHGTATINPTTGAVTYTPALGYVGTDSVVYNVCDNAIPSNCQTGVIYLTITPVVTPPSTIANADFATVVASPNGTNSVSGNVLLNDNNTAGAPLTASIVTGPTASQGTFTLNADGSYNFVPAPGFSGPVIITYKACDGSTPPICAINVLEILVTPAPVAIVNVINPDFGVTNLAAPLAGNLNTNDIVPTGTTYGQPVNNPSNPTGATIVVNPNGTYTFNATKAGTYTYYIPTCAAGQTTGCPLVPLVITVVDPMSNTNPPIANPDIATTIENTPVTSNVLANDKAANLGVSLNPASLSIAIAPKNGTVVVNSDGTITYTPATGFVGTDSLTYTVCDNAAPTPICKTAVVYYTVKATSSNPATIAVDDFANTYAGNTVAGNVLTNDKNSGGATLIISSVSTVPASKGVLLMNTNGTYSFTPAPGFTGPIEIVYTVCGGAPSVCANATLHLLVTPVIPTKILDVIKVANSAKMNLDGSFNIDFVIKVKNLTPEYIDSVLVKDDLTKVFKDTRGVSVVSIIVSGKLIKNNNYDGISNTDLLFIQSALDAKKEDSIILTVNVQSNQSGNFVNTAIVTAPSIFGMVNLSSTDPSKIGTVGDTTRKPTEFVIPKVEVTIPGGFSPNNDGIDDAWIIKRPYGTNIAVKIFNRWGNEVYSNANYQNDWRGKGISNFIGDDIPEGTYYYIVEATDITGVIRKFASSLTLVR